MRIKLDKNKFYRIYSYPFSRFIDVVNGYQGFSAVTPIKNFIWMLPALLEVILSEPVKQSGPFFDSVTLMKLMPL